MNDYIHSGIETVKYVGDALSLSALIAYFAGLLPLIATALTIIWTVIRIYETETVQKWLRNKQDGTNPPS